MMEVVLKKERKMTLPTKLKKKAKSQYGSGLVICLVKFAEHAEKWLQDKEMYQQLRKKDPDLFSESHAVQQFFYGAADHLNDIKVPEKWRGKPIGDKVQELRGFVLPIRHNFTRQCSEEDVIKAYDLCREIALLVDKKLGLLPDIGKW